MKRLAGDDDLRSVDEMEPWVKEDSRNAYRRVDRVAVQLDGIGATVPDGSPELDTLDRLSHAALMLVEFPEGRGATCFNYRQCEWIMRWFEKLAGVDPPALQDLPEFSVVDTEEWTFVKGVDDWSPAGCETFTLTSDELVERYPDYKVKAIGFVEPEPAKPVGPPPRNIEP